MQLLLVRKGCKLNKLCWECGTPLNGNDVHVRRGGIEVCRLCSSKPSTDDHKSEITEAEVEAWRAVRKEWDTFENKSSTIAELRRQIARLDAMKEKRSNDAKA